LYYLYVIKIGRSEEEFFNASTRKTLYIVEKYFGEYKQAVDKQAKEVGSMREFLKMR